MSSYDCVWVAPLVNTYLSIRFTASCHPHKLGPWPGMQRISVPSTNVCDPLERRPIRCPKARMPAYAYRLSQSCEPWLSKPPSDFPTVCCQRVLHVPVPSGCTLASMLSSDATSTFFGMLPIQISRAFSSAHTLAQRVPGLATLQQGTPLASLLRHIKHLVQRHPVIPSDVVSLDLLFVRIDLFLKILYADTPCPKQT